MRKVLLFIFIAICIFSNCTKEQTLQEKAIKVIETSYKDFLLDKLEYSPIDSMYTEIYDTPAYRENKSKMIEYYDSWNKEKADHDYEKARFGTEITKNLILFYQKCIRECLNRENELKSKFIPRFKGYVIQQLYCIHTDFGDSIKLNTYSLNNDITEATLINTQNIPMELYNLINQDGRFFSSNILRRDSIVAEFYNYDFSNLEEILAIDTTNFIK